MSEWAPNPESRQETSLLDFWGILRRRKYVVLLTLVVGVAAAVGIVVLQTPRYTSTTQLLFLAQNSSTGSGSSNPSSELTSGQLATDIQLIQSSPVKAEAAKLLGRAAPIATVVEIGTTSVASISVTSPNAALAAKAANAYAKAYINVTNSQYLSSQVAAESSLQKQLTTINDSITALTNQLNGIKVGSSAANTIAGQLTGLYSQQAVLQQQLNAMQAATSQNSASGQIVQPATVSEKPSSPKRTTDILIGAAAGLLLGLGFALLRDNLDDRVRGKDQLEQLLPGIPVLGLIPVIEDWRDRKRPYLVARTHPKSPPTEAYRGLRTSIQFMALDSPTKVLQITSPSAGDGKTTTSANLAWIMAEAGQRVVLVGCDLRRPRIHEFFGLPNDIGFTSVLLGEAELEDALLRVPNQSRLQVLPTGPVPPNPSELLSSAKTHEVFRRLSAYADIVVVDSAPILPVTDAAVLSTNADAILLVVSAGMDRRRDTVRSVEMLRQINAPIVGTVLNRATVADSYAYYNYGYGEKSSDKVEVKTGGKMRGTPITATMNGNGDMGGNTNPVKVLPGEVGDADWPSMGRHAKLGQSTAPGTPTLFPPQTGDGPGE
jgi:succinoglycan biosynthesis transport protein ExoP